MFNLCINRLMTCESPSTFCSDECRSIYHKVLWCRNSPTSLFKLDILNLLCAPTNDPQYEDQKCLDFSVNAKKNNKPEYPGYFTICSSETITNLSAECMGGCRNGLMTHRNNCCSVNIAVVREIEGGQNKNDMISLYSDRLWKHCGVESPQMCPDPACPTSPVLPTPTIPPPTPTIPPATAPPETGTASKHCMNWFVLFIIVLISCI